MDEIKKYTRYHDKARLYLLSKDPVRMLSRDAVKMQREMEMFETKRAELFHLIGQVPDRGKCEDFSRFADQVLSLPLPDSDKHLMERYIRDGELLHLVDSALSTRLSERDAMVMSDAICRGYSDDELSKAYALNEPTIRRIRRKGLRAIRDEIQMRMLLVPELKSAADRFAEDTDNS